MTQVEFDTKEESVNADSLIYRIRSYAGKSRKDKGIRSPNLTAREAIVLTDYILELEIQLSDWKGHCL